MKVCHWLYNSYTTVYPPVRGDNPRALASGVSPVQADKPWYNLISMKYFMLKFAISEKVVIRCSKSIMASHLMHLSATIVKAEKM